LPFKFHPRLKVNTARHLVVLLAVSGVLAFAEDQVAKTPALISNPTYQNNCAKCHGKNAEGRFMAGPSLRSKKVAAATSDELRTMIASGKGRMPKFGGKLAGGEIEALIDQIKAASAQ
jgi:mono/diheme cytochrome c family protein